uniref:Uncharacterized protein n=1 Tax=Anopheles albimanus TaxID=7167 RepID=A0A182FXU8_ANOAL
PWTDVSLVVRVRVGAGALGQLLQPSAASCAAAAAAVCRAGCYMLVRVSVCMCVYVSCKLLKELE